MHGSPTDNLLRDCSYRMLRIRHLYQILTEIGLPNLAEAYLKDYGKYSDNLTSVYALFYCFCRL